MNDTMPLLDALQPYLPYLLVLALLLMAVSLILTVLVLRRASVRAFQAEDDDAVPVQPPLPDPTPDFRAAIAAMRERIGGRDFRYRVPWALLLGDTDSGKGALFEAAAAGAAGPRSAIGGPGCRFWFFDTGMVLDLAGEIPFGDPSPSQDAWHRFERLLRHHRPERPLDAVVVAVAAEALTEALSGDDEKLSQRGQHLYDLLSSLQLEIGLRLPVYLLITRSDALPGFVELARALPLSVRDNMLGWSNPASADTAYSFRWIDDAFDDLFGHAMRLQLETFADRDDIADRESLALLPHRLRSLAEPVQQLTNSIFRDTAYREDFAFRGIYFAGSIGVTVPADGPTPPGDSVPVFLRDLFVGKIFREAGLARPTRGTYLGRDRRILWIQSGIVATLVVGTIWLVQGGLQLHALDEAASEIVTELMPYVEDYSDSGATTTNIATDSQPVSGGRIGLTDNDSRRVAEVLSLLDSMSRIDATWQITLFPSYWLTDLSDDLERALQIALRRILFGIRNALDGRLAQISALTSCASPDAAVAGLSNPTGSSGIAAESVGLDPALRNSDFLALRDFVTELRAWEENAALFNQLTAERIIQPLSPLVQYLYQSELPASFQRRPGFYHAALQTVVLPRLQSNSQSATRAFNHRVTCFVGALRNGDLLVQLRALQQRLGNLQSLLSTGQQQRLAAYRDAAGAFDSASRALTSPAGAWIDQADPLFGPGFSALLTQAQGSILLTNAGQTLRTEAEQIYESIRTELLDLRSTPTGPLLTVSQNGRPDLQFSDTARSLDSALSTWLGRSFMADVQGTPSRPMSMAWARWQTDRLAQAVAFYEDYLLFQVGELQSFESTLRSSVEATAKAQLEANIMAAVAAAQRSGTGPPPSGDTEALRQAVVTFRSTAPLLVALVDHVNQLQLTDAAAILPEIVRTQGSALLTQVNQVVEDENLYRPNPPAAPGGAGTGTAAVNRYLVAQRSRITDLANGFAAPLTGVLTRSTVQGASANGDSSSAGSADALVARWQGIQQALQAYANQQPGSTLAALEQTVRAVYGDENACQAVQGQSTTGAPIDFFDSRRLDLLENVSIQCRQVASADTLDNYDRLSSSFNRLLAGRFPFSDDAGLRRDPQLNPDNLRSFFTQYDALADGLPEGLEAAAIPDAARQQALDFVQGLAGARAFFAAYLASDPASGPPAFILEPTFRVNRSTSQRSDEIAEWVLATGGASVVQPGDTGTIAWDYGSAIEIRLRWPIDYTIGPIADANQSALSVIQQTAQFSGGTERLAVFTYDGPWALLAMARQQANPGGGPREVLRFQVPVQNLAEDQQNQTPDPPSAILFIQVTPREPPPEEGPQQPGQRLTIPDFPSAAPSLPAPAG